MNCDMKSGYAFIFMEIKFIVKINKIRVDDFIGVKVKFASMNNSRSKVSDKDTYYLIHYTVLLYIKWIYKLILQIKNLIIFNSPRIFNRWRFLIKLDTSNLTIHILNMDE